MDLKIFILNLFILNCYGKVLFQQPEQVHLSLGRNYNDYFKEIFYFYFLFTVNPSEMIVTWVTFDPTAISTVEYGIDNLNNSAVGISTLFVDGGTEKRKLYIHRVTLKNLKPNQKYSNFNIMQIILFYE